MQNLFYRIHGIPGVNGYDRLHNIHLGVIPKVIASFRKTLTESRSLERAAQWQISYLSYVRSHVRFSGFRIFSSIDSKRNFDDNNSFVVLLPLLFPTFLFQVSHEKFQVEPDGATKVLMALVTFLQLTFPAQRAGFSSAQLDMLQQSAVKCGSAFTFFLLIALPTPQFPHALPQALPLAQAGRR